jgi:hypothetical protein
MRGPRNGALAADEEGDVGTAAAALEVLLRSTAVLVAGPVLVLPVLGALRRPTGAAEQCG